MNLVEEIDNLTDEQREQLLIKTKEDMDKVMHRDDCLGDWGHIYAHNDTYDIEITLRRKRR